jgi:hypothetical protein
MSYSADPHSRSLIGPERVRNHDARRRAGGFEEPLHEPLRGLGVSPSLDQDVENEAVLIDGAPWPVPLPADRDDDFLRPYAICRRQPEFARPQ